uniref:MSH6 n=1 Tax=Arundo donax TaxID=35708 RepID=A0A0A9FY66_ARUDO
MTSVMLYNLTCLSFLKYRFDGFRSLSMCFRSDSFVSDIIGIPTPFSFPTIPYRFRFREKNMKVKVVEPSTDRFRSFSSLIIWYKRTLA